MILRPTHSRVIMAAAIAGRDSTARYSAMRGPTAAWRAVIDITLALTGSEVPGIVTRLYTLISSTISAPNAQF
jgi:hypothetical protein